MAYEHIFFDFVIYFFLIVVGAGVLELVDRYKKNKRSLLLPLVFILLFSWLVIFYGSFVEPKLILIKEYDVDLSNSGSEQIKAVVLGDFHLGPYNDEYLVKNVVRKVNRIKPDIILLVGDFISYQTEEVEGFVPFNELWAPLGIYAVTGNHDYKGDVDKVVESLSQYQINFLRNRGATIKLNGREIYIAGVDDYWDGEMDITRSLISARPGQKVIFLAHNPDVVKYVPENYHFDLIVSGHTHGGQIRLPYIGSLVQPPTDLPKEYSRGLCSWQGENLFITPGLGEIGPRARLFNPPEISVLNITY